MSEIGLASGPFGPRRYLESYCPATCTYHAHFRSSYFTHGISDAQLAAQGEDPRLVLTRFAEDCGRDIILGHNVFFDLSMLVSQGAKYGIDLNHIRHQDTYDMAQRFLQADSYRLGDLEKQLALGRKPTHRALDDVLTTVELLRFLLPYIRAQAQNRREVIAGHNAFFEPTARVFQGLRLLSHTRRPHEVVRHLLSELGIWDHFRKEPERTANIEQLISFFQEQDPAHMHHHDALRSLVEYASLAKNVDHIARSSASVIVVPVHQSKGLEFDTVFIAGAVEGMMPLFFAKTQKELEEEKRVFYVALTRPKKRLYVSGYKRFIARNGNVMRKEMSNYVARLGQNVEYV